MPFGEVTGWSINNGHVKRTFEFNNYSHCVNFSNVVVTLSLQEGHIPNICQKDSRFVEISYNIYLAGGMTVHDFIMAAKLNARGRNHTGFYVC